MKLMRISQKKIAVAAVFTIALVAASVGIAAWMVTGSGTGYAKASSSSALTLTDASASTTADLYPGASGTVKLKVSNPNPFPVRITAVSGSGAITSDQGAACDAATGVAFVDQSALTLDLAANATNQVLTLAAGSVTMSNASDNSCQGAVFSIPVSLTAASNA